MVGGVKWEKGVGGKTSVEGDCDTWRSSGVAIRK